MVVRQTTIAFAIYGPDWPSTSDTAVSRLALGYDNPIGSGVASVPPSYAVEAYDVHPYSMPIWHLPPPPQTLEPLPAEALALPADAGAAPARPCP